MQILNQLQIEQKIERLAYQIYENNYNEQELYLAGINNNGLAFAKLIQEVLTRISKIEIKLCNIRLNPANPSKEEITLDITSSELNGKVLIIVDDVANTGRTIFYAFKNLFDIVLKKIEVAVLVDRMHKNFPIKVDYVGISLATTIKENIRVNLTSKPGYHVTLE